MKKFQRKRTIFGKSSSFSLENLRKLSPHQKSFPSEDKLEKPAYTSALAYGLDHHIPTNINKNAIFTEFEQFFQNFFRDISHIPEDEHETYQTYLRMKTKLSNTCEKFCNAKGSYKYRDIVSKLSKRQDISKEKAAEYYLQNKETIKEKSKNRYKNMSKEEKDTIKEYQRKIHQQLIQYKKEALQNKLVLFLLSIRMR